jgi:predicted nucleotidyltransferase
VRTTGPGQSALLLLDAIQVLTREKIEYAVIGAMAASIHGVVRASVDADVVLSLASQRRPSLEEQFKHAGFETESRVGDPDDPIPALLQLTDSFENRVDLLIGLRGLEPEAFLRAVEVPFQGAALRVISREDFIAMKVFAAGPQDMVDAKNAILGAGESLDVALVKRLAKRFGRSTSERLQKLLGD